MNASQDQGGMLARPIVSTNPSRATRQTLSDLLKPSIDGVTNIVCDGIFEPGFDPVAYEAKTTILNPGIRVRCEAGPDIRIEYPEIGAKQECIPVLDSENRELCMSGVSS